MRTDPSGPAEQVRRVAVRLAALAQTGLAYPGNAYDEQRYRQVRDAAASLLAVLDGPPGPPDADGWRLVLARDDGYATPKVDVRTAVFDGDRVLLVRERVDGGWTLPGGWADVSESPAEAAARETGEEAGLEVTIGKLAAVWDRDRHPHQPAFPFHVYKMFF
ncbi:MAG: NUDIX hydrolase N-terminal domain-containing protein, partial [Actinomycetota bacterium]|nr:NUDIX hydrolase N-terminal domain-containing protein [Actinomycetota bacterium]